MRRRTGVHYVIGVILLVVCILWGVISIAQQEKAANDVFVGATYGEETTNDVFTDAFFEGMTGISPFMIPEKALEGKAADDLVFLLKSIQLQPTEDTPPRESETRYGGNQGFCVYYQDETEVYFSAKGAMLLIGSEAYYVVNDNGEHETDFGDAVWHYFYPEA